MSSDKETEKSSTFGTLCDVDEVDQPMSASQMKDLVCAIVEEITSGARRDVHAKLHAVYKKFAKSTPVEGKLTDSNKLEVFNQTRSRVQNLVMEVMESLSFRNTEVSKRLVNGGVEKEPFEYFTALMGSSQLNHQKQDMSLFQLTIMNLLP